MAKRKEETKPKIDEVGTSKDKPGDATAGKRNLDLSAAKAGKNDEFYTQWVDIEREMIAYLELSGAISQNSLHCTSWTSA